MSVSNQMIYLSIHGLEDGKKIFKCGTRYDWYLIEKTPKYKTTIVNDQEGVILDIDMGNFNWLPNYNLNIIQQILAKDIDEKCPIIYNRSNYGSDKKYTSKTENSEYCYPCIHTTPKKGIRYIYSKYNDKGHFGISKVIFGQSNYKNPIIDMKGEYGMSEHSMAIKINTLADANKIVNCFKKDKFDILIDSCSWSNYMLDWRLFNYLKKDFYNYFI